MKTIIDSARDPMTGRTNIRVRPEFADAFCVFLKSKEWPFDEDGEIHQYTTPSGVTVPVRPFLVYELDEAMKVEIKDWDLNQ